MLNLLLLNQRVTIQDLPALTNSLKERKQNGILNEEETVLIYMAVEMAVSGERKKGYQALCDLETMPREEAAQILKELCSLFFWEPEQPLQSNVVILNQDRFQLALAQDDHYSCLRLFSQQGLLESVNVKSSAFQTWRRSTGLIHDLDAYLFWGETKLEAHLNNMLNGKLPTASQTQREARMYPMKESISHQQLEKLINEGNHAEIERFLKQRPADFEQVSMIELLLTLPVNPERIERFPAFYKKVVAAAEKVEESITLRKAIRLETIRIALERQA